MKTGADCVMDGFKRAGVKTIFGLPGGAVLDLFSKLYHAPFEFILARHEQGAAHMADGYARATGQPGCCIVTSGPGATNTVTGLATAFADGVPMVCVSGQVPSSMIGNDAFQEADTTGITRGITKHNYLVARANDIPRIMAEAFHLAATGRQGPVLIDIPKDIQQAPVTATEPGPLHLPSYQPADDPDPARLQELADAIDRSRKPLLYVGGGVITGNASDELTALAHKARIPVTTTLMGLGAFPDTDPLALRMLGMHGSVAANRAVDHCDLLISVGARFDDRVTGKVSAFAVHAKKAHIDIDPSSINKNVVVDIAVVGHARNVLRKLSRAVKTADRSEWLGQLKQWQEKHPFAYDRRTAQVLPQYVIEQLYTVTGGEAIVATDVGQHQMWAAHFYRYTKPRTFLSSGGLGTMGYGLPAAIGAQAGFRDKVVVVIAGDGSIQMNFQELVVAVEHELPVKVVIINNGHLGMVRQWQELFYKKEYSASVLGRRGRTGMERIREPDRNGYLPDFIRLAEAHGAVGIRVKSKDEVAPALRLALETAGPVVVECIVKPDENVYPMVPPGAALADQAHGVTLV
ncbi:MAG: biosynthetic-type acetolactate synthase large subunit [Verrucomicrobiota bacterium]|nr:biosynthetic-type acetolactate synthase large subunit [Verrucomicrobiota bacterium]